ncbi:MAG TPA: protein kinase [Thermoanaerobaculia bacterium]|jgi:TolB-like protein/tetratricopeptide (TPR) repeat protein
MTLAAGTKLGSYQIVAPLGAGGMGEVYRARDSKLDRDVAIKVLPETVAADADALARFEREAKAVAALSHPNILAIFDFGSHDGTAYAVTELLEGETLRGRIDGAAIGQRLALDWALQIARGLSAAHSRGVVHRDLKPENVFVTKDGHVKILDFGLAKRVEASAPDEQTSAPTGGHTAAGTVMGTMGYMSPEQLRGMAVDHRSDIFSFGAILYELLSGRKAFKRDTASDTIAAVLKEQPPELTQTGRNISPALDHIVRHCLEKDRDDRFQTTKDVVFALSEASSPTTAVTSGAQAVVAEKRGSRKGLAIAAAAILVLAAAAGILLSRRPKPAAPAAAPGVKRIAVLPFENLGSAEDDYFSDGIADEVRAKLTSVPGIEVIARGSSTPYKKTTKTPKQIADELNANYLLTATVRWQKGGGTSRVLVTPELIELRESAAPASKWQQPFDAALTDVFHVQSDIASKVAQSLGVVLGAGEEKRISEKPTENLAAYDAFLKGEAASGGMAAGDPPSMRKALAFYEQAVALDPRFAQAWAAVSITSSGLYANTAPTPQLAERAREAAEKAVALAANHPDGYHAMGRYLDFVKNDFAHAQEQYGKALELDPTNVPVLASQASTQESLGRWDTAVEQMKQAERLDPRSLITLRRLGAALLYTHRPSEARAVFDHALALAPNNVSILEYKAMTFLMEGDLSGARAVLANAPKEIGRPELVAFTAQFQDLVWLLDDAQKELLLGMQPSAFDDDKGAWGLCMTQAYALKGDASNVRKFAEVARAAFEEQLRMAPDDAQRQVLLGLSLAYLGRKDEATRAGERGVQMRPISKDGYIGPYIQHQLARIYILGGEPEKALDQLEPLLKVPYSLSPGWLKIDPNFDPLRNNPRFQKLVATAK